MQNVPKPVLSLDNNPVFRREFNGIQKSVYRISRITTIVFKYTLYFAYEYACTLFLVTFLNNSYIIALINKFKVKTSFIKL